VGQRSEMSPEETCHQAMPPRGAVDATGHPWPDTKATSKLLNLRFARTDHATAVIEFGWLRVAAGHQSESVVDSSMGKRAGCPEWTHSGVLTTFGECCALPS
jgi:hypothetical protein